MMPEWLGLVVSGWVAGDDGADGAGGDADLRPVAVHHPGPHHPGTGDQPGRSAACLHVCLFFTFRS